MKKIRKFLQLSRSEQLLLFQAILWLGIVTLGLKLLPLLTLQRRLLKLAHWHAHLMPVCCPSAQRITWAIQVASLCVPQAACLAQALAAQFLFIQSGYPADLQIGVARGEAGKFEAHAWVTNESGTLIGDLPDLARFVPLSSKKLSEKSLWRHNSK
jgi:hypothetical protein